MDEIKVIEHVFNNVQIKQRKSDGYLDATAMCRANGKLYADYQRLKTTKEFLSELEDVMGIPITEQNQELIQIVQGGNPRSQGTWIHPQVAINLAQWCSPKFAVLVSQWVFELMKTGFVSINTEISKQHNDIADAILIAQAAGEMLRMSDSSKLLMLSKIAEGNDKAVKMLPVYTGSDNGATKPISSLLKDFNINLSAFVFNKKLLANEILKIVERKSKSKNIKVFKSLTEKGLYYGKNLNNPNNQLETQPHFYINKFQELLDIILN